MGYGSGKTAEFWKPYCISEGRDQPGNPAAQGERRASHEGHKLSAEKAKKILSDGTIRGHAITDKQKRFFGAIAGGEKPHKK